MRKFKLENDFKRWAISELRKIPKSWWMSHWSSQVRGIPDITGCYKGLFYAIELKLDGKRKDKGRETLQERNINLIYEAGGHAWSRITPSQWESFYQRLLEE